MQTRSKNSRALKFSSSAWESASSHFHRLALPLFILGSLTYGLAFAWYLLTNFDLFNLIRDVNNDDSFYYFEIAKNLSDGKFSTFDSGITHTNGYHPLWLFLITPFYWLFDLNTALFSIKAFEIMLVAVATILVALAVSMCRLPLLPLIAVLPIFYRVHALYHGLEGAAALLMLGLLFLALSLYGRDSVRRIWPLVAVAFLLPWVRLEFVAISLTATATLSVLEWSWQAKPPNPSLKALVRSIPVRAVVPFLSACSGIFMYLLYNRLVFGGFFPVSAASKQVWSQTRWEREGGYDLVQNFKDVLGIRWFNDELAMALVICACIILVWWFARNSRSREDWLLLIFLVGAFSLAVGHLAKFAQTVLLVHPYWGGYSWYFVPAFMMIALIFPISCYVSVHFIRRLLGTRRFVANVLSLGIVIVASVSPFLIKVDIAHPFKYVDSVSGSSEREWEVTSYAGVQILNRILPEDSIVGAWDSGVIGYFSHFPVVNLDGLVNSYEYMRAKKEGRAELYYDKYGITHFANARNAETHVDNTLFEGVTFPRDGGREYEFKLWSAEPLSTSSGEFDIGGWLWKQIEPHFSYQQDGIGIIIDGDMAQVFAKYCQPERLQHKTFVFSWSAEGSGESTATRYPWQSPRKNHLGYCVEAFILPDEVLHPIRIDIASKTQP